MELKECLEQMERCWRWLAANPTKRKTDAVRAGALDPGLLSKCPCCEFTKVWKDEEDGFPFSGYRPVCVNCPAYDLWTGGKITGAETPCLIWMSPFERWDKGYDKAENATKIADWATTQLAKLEQSTLTTKEIGWEDTDNDCGAY